MKLFERRNDPDAAEVFWKETEAAVGETIVVYGLAKYISGGEEESDLWGIAFVTPTRLFFRHFPQQSWVTAIMLTSTRDRSDKKKKRQRTGHHPLLGPYSVRSSGGCVGERTLVAEAVSRVPGVAAAPCPERGPCRGGWHPAGRVLRGAQPTGVRQSASGRTSLIRTELVLRYVVVTLTGTKFD